MDDWDRFEEQLLTDPATRAAYEALRPAYEFASQVMHIRRELGLTQKELARQAGMTQPAIARLEAAQVTPTWDTVCRIYAAVGAEYAVRFNTPDGRTVTLHGLGATSRKALARRSPKSPAIAEPSAPARRQRPRTDRGQPLAPTG
jgi:transcriptional regulator with XRE-family HTH domain